ncbi:MAG: hypothetical protein JKY04_05880 [Sneathiella sp.]|nr:hypothetical protein [Sneathiella sp.]
MKVTNINRKLLANNHKELCSEALDLFVLATELTREPKAIAEGFYSIRKSKKLVKVLNNQCLYRVDMTLPDSNSFNQSKISIVSKEYLNLVIESDKYSHFKLRMDSAGTVLIEGKNCWEANFMLYFNEESFHKSIIFWANEVSGRSLAADMIGPNIDSLL